MDVTALEAALPALTILAVATAPAGLTSSAYVYVADARRAATATVEAWWRPLPQRLVGQTLARSAVAQPYELEISKAGATHAERVDWAQAVRAYLHGRRRPASITRHDYTAVLDVSEPHPSEGPAGAVRILVEFLGEGEEVA